MKKLILIIICFVSLQLVAQGNLQFNQAIYSTSGSITVPAGKVWKIEAINSTNGTISSSLDNCVNIGNQGSSCQWDGSQGATGVECFYGGDPIISIGAFSLLSDETCTMYRTNLAIPCDACPGAIQIPTTSLASLSLPIWLPEGETVSINATDISISILEFNVVP